MSRQNKMTKKHIVAKKFTAERISRRAEEKRKIERQEETRKVLASADRQE